MIGYVTLGVKSMRAGKAFYTELLGAQVLKDIGRLAMIGKSMDQPVLAVCKPFDEGEAHPGNGVMVAFPGGSKAGVDELYDKAISLGATCDGAPGQRMKDEFYGAYVKDPDGNKLCFFEFS